MEERILGVEDTIEETDSSKKILNPKNSKHKTSRKSGIP